MIVVGPLNVPGASVALRVHSNRDKFVLAVDDAATMPTFPDLSTPTDANSGLNPAPEIFAVWATTHALGFEQSRSTQKITLFVSVPCGPHELVHGPDPSAPCR